MDILIKFINGQVFKLDSSIIVNHRLQTNNLNRSDLTLNQYEHMLFDVQTNKKWLYEKMKYDDIKDHLILYTTLPFNFKNYFDLIEFYENN